MMLNFIGNNNKSLLKIDLIQHKVKRFSNFLSFNKKFINRSNYLFIGFYSSFTNFMYFNILSGLIHIPNIHEKTYSF